MGASTGASVSGGTYITDGAGDGAEELTSDGAVEAVTEGAWVGAGEAVGRGEMVGVGGKTVTSAQFQNCSGAPCPLLLRGNEHIPRLGDQSLSGKALP